MSEQQKQLFEDFQSLLKLVKAREQLHADLIERLRNMLLSQDDHYYQLNFITPLSQKLNHRLALIDAQQNILLSKYNAKPTLPPSQVKIIHRVRNRLSQLIDCVYQKNTAVMGSSRRAQEKYKQVSKGLRDWGVGGKSNPHHLMLLVINYTREKTRYELQKLLTYKERLQNYEELKFSEIYFEEKGQSKKPKRFQDKPQGNSHPKKVQKAQKSKSKQAQDDSIRNKRCFYVSSVLLKNYSMLNLSRSQLAEDYIHPDDQEIKNKLYNDLMVRNLQISNCISRYFQRSKSQLQLKVDRFMQTYHHVPQSFGSKSKGSKSSSDRQISLVRISSRRLSARRSRPESIDQNQQKPFVQGYKTQRSSLGRRSVKKVFVNFLQTSNKREVKDEKGVKEQKGEENKSQGSDKSFQLYDLNEFKKSQIFKNRNKMLKKNVVRDIRIKSRLDIRNPDQSYNLKEKVKLQLKNVVLDLQTKPRPKIEQFRGSVLARTPLRNARKAAGMRYRKLDQ